MKNNMFIVYKFTNLISNKSYIGYTKFSLEKRWDQHCKLSNKNLDNRKFYNAIRKYGTDCWNKEILFEVEEHGCAQKKEIEFIEKFDTFNNGYNLTLGGDGNNGIVMSEASNLKRSIALKGKPKSKETIAKFKSRTQTSETIDKISMSHKGKKKPWVKWNSDQITKRALTRRSLSKDQYDTIIMMKKQNKSLKNISILLNINYDVVKKWHNKSWDL